MWPILAAVGGEMVGSAMQANYNSKESGKNRGWQQFMSSTAYSRAAHDLKSAGLNRVLALGNPASTPGGGQASMEAPHLGSVGIAAASAKQSIAQSKAEEKLIGQKQLESESSEALNKAMALTQGSQQVLNAANAASAAAQTKVLDETARKVKFEADQKQMLNPVYKAGGDIIEFLDRYIRDNLSSAKQPSSSIADKLRSVLESSNSAGKKYKWYQDDPDKGWLDTARKKVIEMRAKKGYPFKYSDERGYYD